MSFDTRLRIGEFAGRCGVNPHDKPADLPAECGEWITDRREFEQHMKKVHGLYETVLPASEKKLSDRAIPTEPRVMGREHVTPKPGKGEYEPKFGKPGSRIEFEKTIPGHWTGGVWGSGEYVPDVILVHEGTVWSQGPVPASVWVQPDGAESEPLAVKLPKRGKPHTLAEYPPTWERDTVVRIEELRRVDALFATERVVGREVSFTEGPRNALHTTWHADRECPDAKTEDESPDRGPWPVADVIEVLLGSAPFPVMPNFCRRCVYLTEPGAAS